MTPGQSLGPSLHTHADTKGTEHVCLSRDTPASSRGCSATYLRVDNGVCIIQPDVVVNEDVVNAGIMGVYPQGLPTLGRELISGPPETKGGAMHCQRKDRAMACM